MALDEDRFELSDVIIKPQRRFWHPATSYGTFGGRKTNNRPSIKLSRDRSSSNSISSLPALPLDHNSNVWIIHQAAVEGNVQKLKDHVGVLKMQGLNVKEALNGTLDVDGLSPLHVAAKFNHHQLAIFLLANGASVDASATDWAVPLHLAIRYRSVDVAVLLIQSGADLNKADRNGATPLHLACNRACAGRAVVNDNDDPILDSCDGAMGPSDRDAWSGDIGMIRVLVAHGANICATNNRGETPLHLVSGENSIHAANILLGTDDEGDTDCYSYVNIKRKDGKSALHLASQMGHVDIMKLLYTKGGNNCEYSTTTNPLHLAAAGGHYESVKLLLDKSFGIPVDSRNNEERTALHEAASCGRLKVMKLLIDEGAEVDSKDKYKFTPLFRAVVKGRTMAVKLLLKHGASLAVEDDQLRSPIHFTVEQGNLEMLSLLINYHGTSQFHSRDAENQTALHYAAYYGHFEILRQLLAHSWNVDSEDSSGRMAIHIAAERGHVRCFALLAEEYEPLALMVTDRDDRTALHLAVMNQHIDTCEACLHCGVDVNLQDKHGFAAIHYAVELEDIKTLKSLLQYGADIDLKENDGNTPLMVAVCRHNVNAMTLLLDRGADMTACDRNGNTFFDIVLNSQNGDLAEKIAKHCRWKEALECKNQSNRYMESLIECCPETCEIYLDRFVSYSKHHPDHLDLAVTYNYKYLVSHPDSMTFAKRKEGRYFGPEVMVDQKRENLLDHPVTKRLLTCKWNSFGRYVYYTSFLFYLLFIISLTALMIIERKINIENAAVTKNETSPSTSKYRKIFEKTNEGRALEFLGFFVLFFCGFQMVKEFFQLIVMNTSKYLTCASNYLEWTIYTTAVVYMGKLIFNEQLAKNKFQIGIISLFLGWMNVLIFLKRVSFCKLHVMMFFNVCLTLTRVLLIFGVVFLAFILTFYQLFIKQDTFNSIPRSIVKVIVMVSGELDYESFLTGSLGKTDAKTQYPLVPFPAISYIVVVLFVLFMVIALMNFLIGLSVGDIETVRKTANLRMLEEQVDFIQDCEACMPVCILKIFSKTTETVYPNRKSRFQRCCERMVDPLYMYVKKMKLSIVKQKAEVHLQKGIFNEDQKDGEHMKTRANDINRLETMLQQQSELLQTLLNKSGRPSRSSIVQNE